MENGQTKATKELGLSNSAITTGVRNARTGKLNMGKYAITFTKTLATSEKLAILERENNTLKKEINEFPSSKNSDGNGKQNIAHYCRWLGISRQDFYKFMKLAMDTCCNNSGYSRE